MGCCLRWLSLGLLLFSICHNGHAVAQLPDYPDESTGRRTALAFLPAT